MSKITMNTAFFFVLLLGAGCALAGTLPVINPVSIEINGKTYTPTNGVFPAVTVMSPTASVGVTIPTSTGAGRLYMCDSAIPATDCFNTNQGTAGEGVYGMLNAQGNVDPTTKASIPMTVGSKQYQVVFGGLSGSPFGGYKQVVLATGGTITINYQAPHKETLAINGNALAATGTIQATANQALTATITANSDDLAASGQVYVAAALPGVGIWFMDANKNWSKWNGTSPFPTFKSGSLANASTVDFGNLDLTGLSDVTIYIGYGVGVGTAADADVLTGKFSSWQIN
ncbi:MAG: hypothetical protein ACYC2R_09250 [Burkholderiales bacterium]